MVLSKSDIIGADDRPTKDVSCPEWGGDVRLRTMSGAERDSFELEYQGTNRANIRARLIAKCAVDENGKPIFSDKDVAKLGQQSALVLDRLFEAACELNGLGDHDVEEMEKNSAAALDGGSTSESPRPSERQ